MEMIEELIKTGKKVTVKDMSNIAFDIVDVQMRESFADMIELVHKGLHQGRIGKEMESKV